MCLREDIGETTDLSEKQPERVAAMRGELVKWLRESDARFPVGVELKGL